MHACMHVSCTVLPEVEMIRKGLLSPAWTCERRFASESSPAGSGQWESGCSVGRGQKAWDQVWIILMKMFYVTTLLRMQTLSQGNADWPDNWRDGAAGFASDEIPNFWFNCTKLKSRAAWLSKSYIVKFWYLHNHSAHRISPQILIWNFFWTISIDWNIVFSCTMHTTCQRAQASEQKSVVANFWWALLTEQLK